MIDFRIYLADAAGPPQPNFRGLGGGVGEGQ